MARSRTRSTGPIGSVVVLAFLAALLSGPLRPCFSHEGHAHGAYAHAPAAQELDPVAHAGHGGHGVHQVSSTQEGEKSHGGCECLGLCQLETSPYLSFGGALAHAALGAPSVVSAGESGSAPAPRAPHSIAFARGPPPVA